MDASLTLNGSSASDVNTCLKYSAMSATVNEAERTQLRGDSLSFAETLGQSIANIGPTLTPAINISVVVALAGIARWVRSINITKHRI
jgi:hypothetical protein